jgi:hypothetical protein
VERDLGRGPVEHTRQVAGGERVASADRVEDGDRDGSGVVRPLLVPDAGTTDPSLHDELADP